MKISFKIVEKLKQTFIDFITNLKQICNKRALVNLYKDIVTCVRIFCTTLFINNNIKIVIKSSTFLDHPILLSLLLSILLSILLKTENMLQNIENMLQNTKIGLKTLKI